MQFQYVHISSKSSCTVSNCVVIVSRLYFDNCFIFSFIYDNVGKVSTIRLFLDRLLNYYVHRLFFIIEKRCDCSNQLSFRLKF